MLHEDTRPTWIAPRSKACLTDAVEALSASTDAPFRIRPLGSRGGEELFEATEEFESGAAGRRFLVGVEPSRHVVRIVVDGDAA